MKMITCGIWGVLAGCLLALSAVAQPSAWDHADSLAQIAMEKEQFPGMAVAVWHRGHSQSRGYGYADAEDRRPVDPARSLFRIGSISKTFTAVGLMRLKEKGKVDLDAQVRDYVPAFTANQYPVTVRQVAWHVGGIRHYREGEFLSNIHYENVEDGLRIFIGDTLLFEPGEKFFYSSYGWNLISAVMETASRKDFLKYMQKKVFKPLGMRNTYPDDVLVEYPDRVQFYVLSDSSNVEGPPVDNSYKWAGGGFLSTADDLLRFGQVAFTTKLLDREILAESWTTATLNDGSKTAYGIGWSVEEDGKGRRWVGHGGGSVGGSSMLVVYPEEELVVAILVNRSGAGIRDLTLEIADLFLAKNATKH